MTDRRIEQLVETALAELPDEGGGAAIVLATSGVPPAMAVLSTGDVYYDGQSVSIGIHASSSAVDRLGHAFTLLIPLEEIAVRVEAVSAHVEKVDPLARISGQVSSIRPTAEPPWVLDMRFRAQPPDHAAIPDHVEYWKAVRAWLAGDRDAPPQIPLAR